ncbi:MAG: hypothetical protein ILA02_01260 [Clostridia bacterium]|nr:hypothetical protein [Clostridia bacterium]
MTIQFVTEYLDNKIAENESYIECSVYDLRVKQNLTKNDVDIFLQYAKTRLENLNYQVYFTGAKFSYKGERKIVESNDYMVAIKVRGDAGDGEQIL